MFILYGMETKMESLFRALGERNRLRMVLLLERGPLNVTELVSIMGISQSNASHHLKLLLEAGAVTRSGRGNWAYYGIRREDPLVDSIVTEAFRHRGSLGGFQDDMTRLARCLSRRKESSRRFFDSLEPGRLEEIASSVPDTACCQDFLLENMPEGALAVDVGTGSGRMIPFLLSRYSRVLAVDGSRGMLDIALRNSSSAGLSSRVEFRLGEAEHLPVENEGADSVMMHMVLHHCGVPSRAIAEAARVLRPGGVLLVVELAEHCDGRFRNNQGDLWPGFTGRTIHDFMEEAGLTPSGTEEYGSESVLAAAGTKGE